MQPNAFLTFGVALLGICIAADTRLATLMADPKLAAASARNLLFFEVLFWASAISGAAALAFGAYRTLLPPVPPKPDMDLREFIDHWLGFSRWRHHNNRFLADEITNETNAALMAMAAQARLDHVTVWGSKESLVQGTVPLSPIPKEEWDFLSVSFIDFLTADDIEDIRAKSDRPNKSDPFYIDIHLNRAQVLRQWPRTRWLQRTRKRFSMWRRGFREH